MAQKKGGKEKKGPAINVKHPSHKYKQYEISGTSLKRKSNFCPKCGIGVFMATHNNRSTCGKCGFTEFKK